MTKKRFIIITVLASVFYFSCVKKKEFSIGPVIEFKSLDVITNDSSYMSITFTDGNGDIGVDQGDTTINGYIKYYYYDSIQKKYVGHYNPFLNDTSINKFTIRKPNDSYEGKPISGEVRVNFAYRHSNSAKKVRYVIYIFDNEGNKSNDLIEEFTFL